MSTSLSHPRSALAVALLLFSAVLLASVSTARAENITYAMANYAYQNGVTLGGTITTNGHTGELVPGDITGYSVVITPVSGSSFTLTPASDHLV